jgi:hypothetical protein
MTFAAGILGAITLILGFSFTTPALPGDIRVLLTGAAVITIFGLIVYAHASGELSRQRSKIFNQHMTLVSHKM